MYDVLCARLLHYIVKFRYVEAKKNGVIVILWLAWPCRVADMVVAAAR